MKFGTIPFLIMSGCVIIFVSALMILSTRQSPPISSLPPTAKTVIKPIIETDTPTLPGSPDGETIIVFSSFTCPACARSFDELAQKHTTDLPTPTIAWKDMPDTRIQPEALPAAIAARCAHKQGKFWEYARLLFENQNNLKIDTYSTLAITLGLDTKKFISCQSDPLITQSVLKDRQEGVQAGVTYTPFMFKS